MLIYHDDEYVRQPKLQKLNRSFLAIPGLHMFGETDFKKAAIPLHEHIHPNRYEFTLILTGSQQYSVGSETYLLTGGDVFMTSPNEVHGSNQMPQSVARFLWFQLDISCACGFLGLDHPFSDRLYETLIGYRRRVTHIPSADIDLLSRSFQCFLADTDAQRRLGHSLFLAFLSALLLPGDDTPQITADIQRVLDYIESHIASELDFDTLADVGTMSVSHLKSKFREQLGTAPREYINRLKIDRAKELLLHGSKTITEVAFDLSFSSSNYFASVFKQFTGYTPTEYLKMNRK